MAGKCPKCEGMVTSAPIEAIDIGNRTFGPLFRGISMLCPHCRTVIGVAIDPVALKADIVREVLKGMGVNSR